MMLTDAQVVAIGLTPPPGAYVGVPFADYLDWPYLSKSALSDFAYLPAQHRAIVDGVIPPKESDAFDFGTAVDGLWVERRALTESGFVIWDGGDKRGDAWKAFKAAHAGARIIKPAQAAMAQAAADALDRNARARELRDGALTQISLVWDCPYTGIRRKGRPDLLHLERRQITDLKTARDVRLHSFRSACSEYHYHWQLKGYEQALQVLEHGPDAILDGTAPPWSPWIIAVRNLPVHSVACRPMSRDAMEFATDELLEQLWRYREAVLSADWPADLLDEQEINMPIWRYKQNVRRQEK